MNFLLWVKWVLTNAKTVVSFVITLKSAKRSEEWGGPKERGRTAALGGPWLRAEASAVKGVRFFNQEARADSCSLETLRSGPLCLTLWEAGSES